MSQAEYFSFLQCGSLCNLKIRKLSQTGHNEMKHYGSVCGSHQETQYLGPTVLSTPEGHLGVIEYKK